MAQIQMLEPVKSEEKDELVGYTEIINDIKSILEKAKYIKPTRLLTISECIQL